MSGARTATNAMREFENAMQSAGVGMPKEGIKADGQIHRFRGTGDKRGNLNAWYLLHLDNWPAGAFGNWRTGERHNWRSGLDPMTPKESAALDAVIRRAKAKAQAEQRQRNEQAAVSAMARWEAASEPDPHHPYLVAKGVKADGVRQAGGVLLVPLYDVNGELWSVQSIAADGSKRFQTGGRIKGCMCPVGLNEPNPQALLICEGWATAATLLEETGGVPVMAAMNAGNLLPVCRAVRKRWPDAAITVAGDDDRDTKGNPGRTKANEAAAAIDALVTFPQFEPGEAGSDFNDMAANRRRAAA